MEDAPQLLTSPRFRYSLRDMAIVIAIASSVLYFAVRDTGNAPRPTGQERDVAIIGRGYFQLMDGNGDYCYTRNGRLFTNADGDLCVGDQRDPWLVEPQINIPMEAIELIVSRNGEVYYRCQDSPHKLCAGALQLARFVNEHALREVSPCIYCATDDSGPVAICDPGTCGCGFLKQGWLESSTAPLLTFRQATIVGFFLLSAYVLMQVRQLQMQVAALTQSLASAGRAPGA